MSKDLALYDLKETTTLGTEIGNDSMGGKRQ